MHTLTGRVYYYYARNINIKPGAAFHTLQLPEVLQVIVPVYIVHGTQK